MRQNKGTEKVLLSIQDSVKKLTMYLYEDTWKKECHYYSSLSTTHNYKYSSSVYNLVNTICAMDWMDLEKKCVPDLHSRGINKNQNQFADFGHFFLALAFDSIQSHFILRSNSHH